MRSPRPRRRFWTWRRALLNLVGLWVWFWCFTLAAFIGVAGDYEVPPTAAESARADHTRAIYLSVVLLLAVGTLVGAVALQVRAWRRRPVTAGADPTPSG